MRRVPTHRRAVGQAAVEAALTLPLVVFLVMGSLQLFMIFQARLIAQYAAFKAVRTGSLMHGDCLAMTHAAIAAVLPAITRVDSPLAYANAFFLRRNNRYDDGTPPHRGQIVELYRESPKLASLLASDPEDNRFDQPGENERLEVRMLFWYRLRIPFADSVISRMVMASWGLRDYTAVDPLMPAHTANWTGSGGPALLSEVWPGGNPGDSMLAWSNGGEYVLPIRVTASMRMMVPPRRSEFPTPGCPL
jgi:hypothetical protein